MQDIIFEHPLRRDEPTPLTLPEGATVVLVGPRGPQGDPHLWVRQPRVTSGREVRRTFLIVPTGLPFPSGARYIGPYVFGPYFRHVLELRETGAQA